MSGLVAVVEMLLEEVVIVGRVVMVEKVVVVVAERWGKWWR